MSLEKVVMPEQLADERINNFKEVTLGYTLDQAMEEAGRCLNCKHKPCMDGCPVNVPIPEFIEALAEGDIKEAYKVLTSENKLPAICGRVCPQESQCESKCVRGIKGEPVGIGRMERFVADYYMEHFSEEALEAESNNVKVAVVGSGPAGITCASELASKGYDVTIFEALHELGGVLIYGIPEFRLPKALVKRELDKVIAMGVKVEKNVIVGKSITIEELIEEEDFKAVFIGSGAGLPRFMNIPGENLNGVYASNEFLTRVNLMKAYRYPEYPTPVVVGEKVVVVGAGNVAMDSARTAKRLGAKEVHIVYRRSETEIPARAEEVHHAKEEGIIFDVLNNPVSFSGEKGELKEMTCVKMELGEPDESGRRRPEVIKGSEYTMPVDTVIMAIGQTPNPLIKNTTPALEITRRGGIAVEQATMETSIKGVYAGGDAVTGAATVILAMGAGKQAAKSIDDQLKKRR